MTLSSTNDVPRSELLNPQTVVQSPLSAFHSRYRLRPFLIARACKRSTADREGCTLLAYNHLLQSPPTTSGFVEGVIYLEKKTVVVVVVADGGGQMGAQGGQTRPPLTYPRADKPFSEPIPRPCTPSAPLYARNEQPREKRSSEALLLFATYAIVPFVEWF